MKNAFDSIKIGSTTLPNRFVMGSMHLGIEGKKGVAERMAAFYDRRFAGEVGMIVTGGISVNEEGKGSKGFLNIESEKSSGMGPSCEITSGNGPSKCQVRPTSCNRMTGSFSASFATASRIFTGSMTPVPLIMNCRTKGGASFSATVYTRSFRVIFLFSIMTICFLVAFGC